MNAKENSTKELSRCLEEIVASYPDRGVHFDNGYSEGDYLVLSVKETIERMDKGASLDETLRALAVEHAPICEDGEDRYGYQPVRQAVIKSGLGEQFDALASEFRVQPKPQPEPGLGARLRRAFSGR